MLSLAVLLILTGAASAIPPPHSHRIPSDHTCTAATCAFSPAHFTASSVIKRANFVGDLAIYLYWNVSSDEQHIEVAVDVRNAPSGWVALGLSANGGMMGADVWRLMEGADGELELTDMFVEDWTTPRVDTEQNLYLIASRQEPGHTSFAFSRNTATCDGGAQRYNAAFGNEDFDIGGVNGDNQHAGQLIWAVSDT